MDHRRLTESCERLKTVWYLNLKTVRDDKPRLLPGLPDEISHQILARIPRIWYLNLKAVSRSWKAAVTSPEIYKIRKELGTTEEWLYILVYQRGAGVSCHALDPISKIWQRLPPIPAARVKLSIGNADAMWAHLGLKVSLGCAIAAVDGCLYMLGGVAKYSSLTDVWKYDPVLNCWSEANNMSVGRANFETGVLNNKLFVIGGERFSRHHGDRNTIITPLQSAEVFDPKTGLWSDIPSMPCSKAHVNTPVAMGLASYKGKLYVPQGFCHWPSFVCGEVYDPETNSWADIPTGMYEGWPSHFRGTKPGVIIDGELYAANPVYSLEGARVYVYNHHNDSWKVVEGDVPLRNHSNYTDITCVHGRSPYILTGLLRKLHAVSVDDNRNIIVMQADKIDDSIASSDEGTSEANTWNVIATRNIRFEGLEHCRRYRLEVFGCQNLNI